MINKLKSILGPDGFDNSELALFAYSKDASGIKGNVLAVVFPKSVEDVQRVVKVAKMYDVGLTIRGNGTNEVGAAVPDNTVVVDMSKMDKILEVGNNWIRIEAGHTLYELNRRLKNKMFPVKIYNDAATIGGMIALNMKNKWVKQYGELNVYIEEIEIVDGTGKNRLLKKDKIRDVIGKEGKTGIIVTVKIKVVDKTKNKSLDILPVNNITELMEKLEILKDNPDVKYIGFWDKFVSERMELEQKMHILVEYDNNQGKITDEDEINRLWMLEDEIDPFLKSIGYVITENFATDKTAKTLFWLKQNNVPCVGILTPNMFRCYFKKSDLKQKELLDFANKNRADFSVYGAGLRYENIPNINQEEYDPKGILNRRIK